MEFLKKFPLKAFSLIAIAVCGYVLHSILKDFFDTTARSIGFIIGRSIGYTTVAFLVGMPFIKLWRKNKLDFLLFCFAISFSVNSAFFITNVLKEADQIDNTQQEIAQIAKVIEEEPSQLPEKEYSKDRYGDFSILLTIIKRGYEFSEKMNSELNKTVSDLENILSPENISEHEKILLSKERVAKFADKVNEYEDSYSKEMVEMESLLHEAFSKNTAMQKEIVKGFKEERKKRSRLMNDYFSVEKEVAQKMNDILDFASTRIGTFWKHDEMIVFKEEEDSKQFNELIQELQDLGLKEEKVAKRMERNRKNMLQRMKNLKKENKDQIK